MCDHGRWFTFRIPPSSFRVQKLCRQGIVITGASDGIGAELARQLAPERPRLVLAARRIDALQAVAAQCEAAGAEAVAVRCDVGVEADCKALAAAAVARFGGIDVLVNNAGVSATRGSRKSPTFSGTRT